MGKAPRSLCSTSTFLEFGLIVVAQACAGQTLHKGEIWNILLSQTQACFFNSERGSNFLCSTVYLEQRHLLQKLLKQGPCRCPPQGKAHAQLCAKGCFLCLRLDFIKQTQLPEKTWDDSLCQVSVVLICHVLVGHLYTVKTNLSTFTQIFFINSSVLKMGLYPGIYPNPIRVWTAETLSRSKGPWKVFQACADVSQTHPQRQPPTPWPGGAALPPAPGLARPGRTWNISQASIPIIHRQRLLVTQRIWGWLFVRPRANSGVPGNAHLRESQPRAAGLNPRIPAAVLRTSQRFPSTPTINK